MFQSKDAEELIKLQNLVTDILDIEDIKKTKEERELNFIKLGAPALPRAGVLPGVFDNDRKKN